MKTLTITMEIENAAFDGESEYEVSRILKEVANKLENGTPVKVIRDINGNKIGEMTLRKI